MTKKYESRPLGLIRPATTHDKHELRIILTSDKNQWRSTLTLDTRQNAKAQFLIFKIEAPLRRPTGEMKQITNTQSEFLVRIQGPAAMASIMNLSPLPIKEWMQTMFSTFAQSQAAIAVLCTHGRVSVTLHGGD
jgi:hypothetical protein